MYYYVNISRCTHSHFKIHATVPEIKFTYYHCTSIDYSVLWESCLFPSLSIVC